MKENRRARSPRPDELRLVRTWWIRVYVKVVHKELIARDQRISDLDAVVAQDLGVKLSTVRTARNGWDNLSPKLLRRLRKKLGVFLSSHPVEIMGTDWPHHLSGSLSLIGENETHDQEA